MKRIFDVLVAVVGLTLLFPVFLLLAIAIKIQSDGPVFYRGERIGKDGKPFRIFKFRSMIANAETIGASTTGLNDSRLTGAGRFIRKFKLDEIAQLINVLLGDMSIVGYRPQVKWAVDLYSAEEKNILKLRPGITDWASLKFYNEEELIAQSGIADPDQAYLQLIHPHKTKLQLKYFYEHNLWIDLKIIFCTVLTIIITKFGGEPVGVPSL